MSPPLFPLALTMPEMFIANLHAAYIFQKD